MFPWKRFQKRPEFCRRDLESGLIRAIEHETQYNAHIGVPGPNAVSNGSAIRILLNRDIELLQEALLHRCRLSIEEPVLRQGIFSFRFEQFSRGRQPR
jgi:hypothetical protein